MELDDLRACIVLVHPELAGSTFSVMTTGWDCLAVDVDDRLIFKFPRHDGAAVRLVTESRILEHVGKGSPVPVPAPTFRPGTPGSGVGSRGFSRHIKIPGDPLISQDYEKLPEAARTRLAGDLAGFYLHLHSLDPEPIARAGAGPVHSWVGPDLIRERTRPHLSPRVQAVAEEALQAWESLPPDPLGSVFGFFDGHGWNMAFDHAVQRLNGLYDFGDAGFGPRHREFIYSNWISTDLTARIMDLYEEGSGLVLDRRRVEILTGVLRLSELAEHAHLPAMVDRMRAPIELWFTPC